MNSIYFLLLITAISVVCGAIVYYVQRIPISDNNKKFQKYKLSKNNILIKLKLFKYDNRFNYFLLIPYLFSCFLFLVVVILYIIYWCGVSQLAVFFVCKWVNVPMAFIPLGLLIYSAFIRELISCTNGLDIPNFTTEENEKKDNLNK